VIAEDMDRFTPDLEEAARLHKIAEFKGVAIWTLADGKIPPCTLA
jgi:hypothetical protein